MKKIQHIIILMLVCICLSLIIPNEHNIEASEQENGNVGLDYDFIYNDVTKSLSEIIFHKIYGIDQDIWKGRCFGTRGEREAADKIETWLYQNTDNLNVIKIKQEEIGNESFGFSDLHIMRRLNNKMEIMEYYVDLREGYLGNPDVIIPNNESFPFPNYTSNAEWENHIVNSGGPIKIHWPPIGSNENPQNEDDINFSAFNLNVTKYKISYTLLNSSVTFIMGEVVYLENYSNASANEKSLKIHLINVSNDEYINTVDTLKNDNATGFILIRDNISVIKNWSINLSGVAVSNQNGSFLKNLTKNGTVFVFPEEKNISSEKGFLKIYHCTDNISSIDKEIYIVNSSWLENRVKVFLDEYNHLVFPAAGFLLCDPQHEQTHFQYPYSTIWDEETLSYSRMLRPMISINGTIVKNGQNKDVWEWVEDKYETDNPVTLNYSITQRKNPEVESYNVYCDIQGKNTDEWFIMSGGHYDGWYGQMTCDNAVGVAQMLGILKYLNDNSITPKCNLRFIFHAGEENVARGSMSHVYNISNRFVLRNAKYIINLCQLGHKYPASFRINTIKPTFMPILKIITENSNYEEKYKNKNYNVRILGIQTNGTTDAVPYAWYYNKMFFLPVKLKYINFCKDSFPMYHRTGINHTVGDTMDVTDREDINATIDIIWNVSKFFIVDPDSWFDGNPQFELSDSDDINSINDAINVTYSIKTAMPQDWVSVRFILFPKYTKQHPVYPLIYRYRERKDYVITPSGISDYINVSIPKQFPEGEYIAKIYLCNSTGDVSLDVIKSINIPLSGVELIDNIKDSMGIDILEKILPRVDEFWEEKRIDIIDWLWRIHDCRKVRNLLIDFLGYNVFFNSSHSYTSFDMAPPNDPPNKPTISYGPTEPVELHDWSKFKAYTTDSNSDQMRFKWNWGGLICSPWSLSSYKNNEKHTKLHQWNNPFLTGDLEVKVKARDTFLNPNYHSPWSDPWEITLEGNGCVYNAFPESGFLPHSTPKQNIVIVGQNMDFTGYSYGIKGRPAYEYDFGDSNTSTSQNPTHNYSTTGIYNITLVVDNGTANATYYDYISVVNISVGFNVSTFGAQPNQTINFTNVTLSYRNITNQTWDFGDGNVSYEQNPSHTYQTEGVYNITLTVRDTFSEEATCYFILYIESNPPAIVDAPYSPIPACLGKNVTIYAEVFDNQSQIKTITVNISRPNNITSNYSMVQSLNSSYDYEYVFNDTMQVGWYYYTIWVTDNANNTNYTEGLGFRITHTLGYSNEGILNKNIKDNISGSNFTILVNGTAQCITVYIHTNQTIAPKTKCMIYRVNDSQLVGTTEEKTYNTGDGPDWVTYNFTGTKPNLITNTSYVIACWSNNTCNLYYDNTTDDKHGKYNETIYGSPPSNIEWTDEPRLYSIYCTYSTIPEVKSATASPDPIGFGFNTTITVDIEHYYTFVENITINITYPNNSFVNNSMTKVDDDTFQYIFNDAWKVGQYNYTIWVKDKLGTSSTGTGYSFNVSAGATIKVCTIKDSYNNNQTVNLTDPPIGAPVIGYELLDNNSVLHIWNPYNSYYFNTSSGIQLTNHYDEYWSHNVLMLGYYNNDNWNLIYRTDDLSGFNKNVSTDNETFVNVTLWKDLTYKGYDFRLAIRYNLGVDDPDLTVIPYIKNLGDAIPYNLAFGWEIKDIKIANTFENDTIRLYNGTNWTNYSLNQTLNNTYNNMDHNTTFILEGLNEDEFFRRTLYLKWDHNLDYLLQVKNRTGQQNAPVTLFIKIGTLATNQEKFTMMNWLDSDEWLGVDGLCYHSCCGYEGPFGPSAALDGNDIWLHLSTENHWLVIDLSNPYNIKKLRGRSNTANDPTSVDIYISNDPDNWGTAVYSGITSWQDTTSWSEIDITDTVGRYINISITSTEGGAGTDYLEFGGIPVPMTIFDVYGDKLASATYYFSNLTSDSQANTWTTNPYNMVDGSTSTYASTSVDGDVEACTVNTCSGTILGTIMKVEMRAYGYHWTNQRDIILRPVFGGSVDGLNYNYQTAISADWSGWFDITDDDSAPACWSWNDIVNLDCDVESESDMGAFTLYCSKVEIRVTYATIPVISNPVPSDGSDGVSITPTLNISVADIEGDPMNITWLSNSSGSWQVLGTNTSVSNGTYHQVFSNATENGKWWYWKVNVSDNTSYNMSGVFKFYTGHQSKIKNTDSTNIKGYLLIQVQYYNITSSSWVVADDTINETTPRTITYGGQFGLDTIFNGNVNTTYLINNFGTGTYRIYAAFRDPDSDVLVCDDESLLESNYQFIISTS
jgi:PKD repeat protein